MNLKYSDLKYNPEGPYSMVHESTQAEEYQGYSSEMALEKDKGVKKIDEQVQTNQGIGTALRRNLGANNDLLNQDKKISEQPEILNLMFLLEESERSNKECRDRLNEFIKKQNEIQIKQLAVDTMAREKSLIQPSFSRSLSSKNFSGSVTKIDESKQENRREDVRKENRESKDENFIQMSSIKKDFTKGKEKGKLCTVLGKLTENFNVIFSEFAGQITNPRDGKLLLNTLEQGRKKFELQLKEFGSKVVLKGRFSELVRLNNIHLSRLARNFRKTKRKTSKIKKYKVELKEQKESLNELEVEFIDQDAELNSLREGMEKARLLKEENKQLSEEIRM